MLENKLPHLLFGNSSDIIWILGALETNQVGACLDTGHAFLSGELYNLVYKLTPYLRMLHVHDNRGHSDEHCPPGDGRIDWGAFLRELIQIHFHGTFILEIAGGKEPAEIMARARRGRSFLREHARRLNLEMSAPVPHR